MIKYNNFYETKIMDQEFYKKGTSITKLYFHRQLDINLLDFFY